MSFWTCAAVYIKWDAELFKRLFDKRMITVYYILRCYAFFLGAYCDGYSVFVRTSDKDYIFFFQSQIADVDISGYINSCQMSDMNRAVSVGQCRRNGSAFEFLFHCDICISFVMSAFWCAKITVFHSKKKRRQWNVQWCIQKDSEIVYRLLIAIP